MLVLQFLLLQLQLELQLLQMLTLMVILSVGGDTFNDIAKSISAGASKAETIRALQEAAPRMTLAMASP